MTYSAVVTTGIYCIPGCGGRPRPENVRPFTDAAAAEAAGFRACLRCRPYRTSQPAGWVGPELACRAVQLIIDGVLDDGGTESDLARRLGVSARHLRRLFAAHVGATPDQVARSRRAHFARRLLDDTDLSITDVAFASGFGSVRQFNRAALELFRATPGELRARRRSADRLVADGGLRLRLPFSAPIDWDTALSYLSARAIPGVERVVDDTYRRTVVIDGHPGVLELGPGGQDHLIVHAHLPRWEGLIHVVQRSRRIFNLDADLDVAALHLGDDPLVGPLLSKHPGLRPPGTWDAFETGVRAILGQQVSVAGASTLAGRLVARFGDPVPGLAELGLSHTFPGPEVLAGTDLSELSDIGVTAARAGAIRAFAAAVVDGTVRLDRSIGLEQLTASITAVPGLGPWTAHYIALRLGEPDAFPAGDLGLRRAAAAAGRHGPTFTTKELAARAEAWRPWRANAAAHLWAA